MKLTFFGAAHQVTGSCHLLETAKKKILIDCGMFQGHRFNEQKNNDPFPFDPIEIDAVFVTHAHADHTGRIPKLIRDGFTGSIYMTKATVELAQLIWLDSYKIMTYNHRKFGHPVLFDTHDIKKALAQCRGVDYREEVGVGDGVVAMWKDAGHIFGSAFIEVNSEGKRVGFSGDLGNEHVPILKDTDQLGALDALVCESTYGDRVHEDERTRKQILLELIVEGVKKRGVIMMPTFSLERTQQILYLLDELREQDKTLPPLKIYVDSPLAIDAIATYKKYPEYYDERALREYTHGNDFLQFPGLTLTRSVEESKKINTVPPPKMIIAGAGMMNGGRILHHAMRYLPDPNSTLIIVGYQAGGTLGRKLYEGAEYVRIFDQDIPVRATIKAIGAFSAHADQKKLLSWIGHGERHPGKVYCVHGEPTAATALAHKIRDELGIKTFVPEEGESVEV